MLAGRQFSSHGHTIQVGAQTTASGWDVQEICDSEIVHVGHFDDWHRVERAILLLEMKALKHDDDADASHR
jgi:hypothetical protein